VGLRQYVRTLDAPVVGAMHITCADETEFQAADSFQRTFVSELLPSLKFTLKAPLRLANLGARHEWGALSIAEHHFATADSHESFKVLLIKINAHVAATGAGDEAEFGRLQRYDAASTACGALHALLAGGEQPFLRDLRETFRLDGRDRIKQLLDKNQVDPRLRSLLVAVTNARLQARRVEQEIAQHRAVSPTFYVITPCVTLNRPEEDRELLCGVHTSDRRLGTQTGTYAGLGDDPARYRVQYDRDRLRINEEQPPA
jgi:hypothetical protein